MTSQHSLIRSIYLYGIAAAGVLMFAFGAWKGVDLVFSKFIFAPEIDVSYCESQAKDRIRYEGTVYNKDGGKRQLDKDLETNEELQQEVTVLKEECEEQTRMSRMTYRKNAMVTIGSEALAWMLVGAVIWGGFGWCARRRD